MQTRRIVHGNRRVLRALAPFNGNFASLFTGVLQSVQTDRGLTYGGTMLDTGGGGPVITLTGALTGPPVPIWVKATTSAALGVWQYAVYYDGTGTTPAMTGTSAATVPLTGAGAGLTLNIAAGTSVLNNIWKATCSALADQSGNAKDYSQATAGKQPLVSIGINGRAALLFDGVDDQMGSSLTLPAPGTTPTYVLSVFQVVTETTNGVTYGDNSAAGAQSLIQGTAGTHLIRSQSGAIGAFTAFTTGTWYRSRAGFQNSAADDFRLGGTSGTPTLAGNTAGAGRAIGGFPASLFSNINLLALLYLNHIASPAELAAYDAAVASFYGGLVSL